MAENNYRQTRLQQLQLGISVDSVSALFLHSLQNPTKTLLFCSQSTVKSLFQLFIYFLLAVTLFFAVAPHHHQQVLNSVIRYPYQVLVLKSLCPLLLWAKVSFSMRTHPGMLLSNIFGIFLHQTSCLQLIHELLKFLLSIELETITFRFLFLQNDLLPLFSSRRQDQGVKVRLVGKNSG